MKGNNAFSTVSAITEASERESKAKSLSAVIPTELLEQTGRILSQMELIRDVKCFANNISHEMGD